MSAAEVLMVIPTPIFVWPAMGLLSERLLVAIAHAKAAFLFPASAGRNLPAPSAPMQSIRERHCNGSLSSMLRAAGKSVVPEPSVRR